MKTAQRDLLKKHKHTKWNAKMYSSNAQEAKRNREKGNRGNNEKTNIKMEDLSLYVSLVILNINGLTISINKQTFAE